MNKGWYPEICDILTKLIAKNGAGVEENGS